MSVPEGKRTESKLAFHTKAIELADYTTTICNNNKIFPKRDRWMITNRIVNAAITILTSVVKANGVADECYESWKAHAEKGDSYLLLQRVDEYYNNLWEGD